MKRVVVTGAEGLVGRALIDGLERDYDLVRVDPHTPDEPTDMLDEAVFSRVVKGADAIVHTAGVFGRNSAVGESWRSPDQDPVNRRLFDALLRTALQHEVPRIVVASSIHVEDSLRLMRSGQTEIPALPGKFLTEPTSGYGRAKREQEATLDHLADRFEHGVATFRLGGVTPDNRPLTEHAGLHPEIVEHERRVFCAYEDLQSFAVAALEQARTGHRVSYLVSNVPGRFYSTQNAFGWKPAADISRHFDSE